MIHFSARQHNTFAGLNPRRTHFGRQILSDKGYNMNTLLNRERWSGASVISIEADQAKEELVKRRGGNSGKEETGRFRAEDGDVEMEFETQKKLIELEGEGHFTRACLDIEVSTGRGNIGNKVRSNLNSETRFKIEVEDRLKADEEAKAVEEGRKMEE
ncbi:hypothetical protein TNCV_1534111 [Trichonephila clavipes]|nr:hypothetical protein TNCV_1534111 [Trichonephila clavipes]